MGNLFSDFSILKFYNLKTVRPSFLFSVRFKNQTNLLQDYHVVDVTIPMYKFKGEWINYGAVTRSFSVIDHTEPFNISVTYEDDHKGTVLRLILELQKTIIDINGLHKPINEQNIGDLDIEIKNMEGKSVALFTAKNVSFLGADDISLQYSSSETAKHKLTFRTDVIKALMYDVNLLPLYDTQNQVTGNLLKSVP
jgi:hypothetical protein